MSQIIVYGFFYLVLDKYGFLLYNDINKIGPKETMNSHITKSNRVFLILFAICEFFLERCKILFNTINGGHSNDTRYSKMV